MVHIVTTSQRGRANPLGAPSRPVVQIDVIKKPLVERTRGRNPFGGARITPASLGF